MQIRRYNAADFDAAIRLFYNSVHSISNRDYFPEQLDAWAPDIDVIQRERRLDERLLSGYFDLLYVHPEYQRQGVATMIADNIEEHVTSQGARTITTDASITAKPFFEQRGYRVVKMQTAQIRGSSLVNFHMEKELPGSNPRATGQ